MSTACGAGYCYKAFKQPMWGRMCPAAHHEPDALHAEFLQDVVHRGVLAAVIRIPKRPVGIHCVIPLLLQQEARSCMTCSHSGGHDADAGVNFRHDT